MRVSDWDKWTRFKKKVVVITLLIGTALVFCIETKSLWYGVVGILFGITSSVVMHTIPSDEW